MFRRVWQKPVSPGLSCNAFDRPGTERFYLQVPYKANNSSYIGTLANYMLYILSARSLQSKYKVTLWMTNSFVNSLIISGIPGAATGGCEMGLKDGLAGICSRWDVEIFRNT